MTAAEEEDPSASNTLRFPDGSAIEFRKLGAGDGRLLAVFGSQLSKESAYRRFLSRGAMPDRRWVARVVNADHRNLLAEGAIATNRFGSNLVAVAESVRIPDKPARAEIAIAVVDSWQGLGLGTLLITRLAQRAVGSGIREWQAMMLADNKPMLRLLDRVGWRLGLEIESGVASVVIGLMEPAETRIPQHARNKVVRKP